MINFNYNWRNSKLLWQSSSTYNKLTETNGNNNAVRQSLRFSKTTLKGNNYFSPFQMLQNIL